MNLSVLASTLALTGVMGMATTGHAQTPGVTHTSAPDVNALFAKPGGGTVTDDPHYKVMVSTRTEGGEAEQHARETDIFYVVEGSATFVTGGTIVGAHETAPDQTRGAGLEGGRAALVQGRGRPGAVLRREGEALRELHGNRATAELV
jgi:hypothetical protein